MTERGSQTGRGLDPQRIAAARVWAAARMPYLACALFAVRMLPAPGSGTVAIDGGWTIHADPAVVAALDAVELGRLLIHLACHPLREHGARAVTLDVEHASWWNRCADAEINDDLSAVGAVPAAAGDLPSTLGFPDHRLAEEYYAGSVPREPAWDCGSGADGARRPWDCDSTTHLTPDQAESLRARTAAEIHQTAQREPGSVPAGLLRWAESVLPSRVDWRRVLAAEIRRAVAAAAGSVDYSYRRPSRRGAAARPALLPTLIRPVPAVAVVCDTSGSMHDGLLARALAEIDCLLARAGLRSAQVRVLAVDTDVHAVRRVSRAADVQLLGGGGTDMGRGIAAAVALRPKPSVVVVLTDGFTPWPPDPPRGARVVVALLNQHGGRAPDVPGWARTVVIEESGC